MWNLVNNSRKIILALFLTVFAIACFQNNFLGFANQKSFFGSKNESESLVLGGIIANDYGLDKGKANIGFVAQNHFKYPDNVLDSYDIYSNKIENVKLDFVPYLSQHGAQGVFFPKYIAYLE